MRIAVAISGVRYPGAILASSNAAIAIATRVKTILFPSIIVGICHEK